MLKYRMTTTVCGVSDLRFGLLCAPFDAIAGHDTSAVQCTCVQEDSSVRREILNDRSIKMKPRGILYHTSHLGLG